MDIQFGNTEVDLVDLLTATRIAGPVGEDTEDHDAIFLKFEALQYSREDVIALVKAIHSMQPDECDVEKETGDLRLWWD